jgi:3-oxoacyl-[acyl-carrier-protein] synthase-3
VSTARIAGVRVAALVAAVPRNEVSLAEEWEALGGEPGQLPRMKQTIGLDRRRVVPDGLTALDLSVAAGKRLMEAGCIDPGTVDGCFMVTQTPDYWQPGNAILLQDRLGLSTRSAAMDLNLGCSGYVYGLWMVHSLIASGGLQRVLLFAGDTISRIVSSRDRSLRPLFGDAASVTLLERANDQEPAFFELCSDGSGAQALWQPGGAFREPLGGAVDADEETAEVHRHRHHLHMDGAEIFNFSLRVGPSSIQSMLAASGWEKETVDGYVLHQANRYILENIRRRLGVEPDRLPSGTVERFGNQSSASIPFTLADHYGARLCERSHRLILSGFGVGLSWATAAVTVPRLSCNEWVEV